MTDEQIRFFLDGVPLDLTGFVERVEIYRGVVPSRFGVDALGGAVNLVTDDDYRHTRASASYQGGSFGTSRVTAAARHRFGDGPLVLRGHVSSPSSKATASSSTNPSPVRS
jgi:outer membrane cobalamin receptor